MIRQFRFVSLGLLVAVANLTPSPGRGQTPEKTPAATLGQPRPAASLSGTVRPVVRAAPPEVSETSTETSVADRTDLDPWKKDASGTKSVDYPPTYSSTKREIVPKVIGDLWKKCGKETTFTAPTTGEGKQTYRDPRRLANAAEPAPVEKGKPTETLPPPKVAPEEKPLATRTIIVAPTNSAVPAWRWYGYGTITPGVSTPHGDGSYPLAPVSWLQETRATPGAIPQGFLTPKISTGLKDAPPNYAREVKAEVPTRSTEEPITVIVPPEEMPRIEVPPAEPFPIRGIPLVPLTVEKAPIIESSREEPRGPIVEPRREEAPIVDDFVLPPPLPPTGTPLTQKDPRGGTTIYFPVPSAPPKASFNGIVKPKTLPPTSMRPGPHSRSADTRILVRAQAPTQPEGVVNSTAIAPKIERAARGAKEVHLHLTKTNRVGIRLIVAPGVDFEAIADRIGAIPELGKFYLDFDVTVRP